MNKSVSSYKYVYKEQSSALLTYLICFLLVIVLDESCLPSKSTTSIHHWLNQYIDTLSDRQQYYQKRQRFNKKRKQLTANCLLKMNRLKYFLQLNSLVPIFYSFLLETIFFNIFCHLSCHASWSSFLTDKATVLAAIIQL